MPDTRQANPFTPAKEVKERHAMVVALEAPPNAGKTWSGCRLCKGAAEAQGKRWAVIDTEGGRTLHLRNHFDFDHRFMEPPHRPEKYLEYARDAQSFGYGAVLIDSFSNVWRGIGGVLHWADEEMEAIVARQREQAERYNRDFNEAWVRDKNKSNSLIRPKTAFKFMMAGLLDLKIPIVLSIRGETIYDPGEKKEIFKTHMQKGIGFDVTCRFRLMPDRKGIIDITDSEKFKMEGDHAAIFRNGEQLSEKHGAALEAWSRNAEFAIDNQSTNRNQAEQPEGKTKKVVDDLIAEMDACTDGDGIEAILGRETVRKQVAWMVDRRPAEHDRLFDFVKTKRATFEGETTSTPATETSGRADDDGDDGQAAPSLAAVGDGSKPEVADQPALSWEIDAGIVGQEPKRQAILALLSQARTKAHVGEIEAEHKDFLDKLGRLKAETMASFRDRKAVLPVAEGDL